MLAYVAEILGFLGALCSAIPVWLDLSGKRLRAQIEAIQPTSPSDSQLKALLLRRGTGSVLAFSTTQAWMFRIGLALLVLSFALKLLSMSGSR
jgi:hypothetical protein